MALDFVRLDDFVESWAHSILKITGSRTAKKLDKKYLETHIQWDRVTFAHDDPIYSDDKYLQVPNAQCLFETNYTNRTDQEQEYSFRTERSSSCTCDITIEKGYSTTKEGGVKITLPGQVFEANAGFKHEIHMTTSKSQTFEETLTWGVDSQVKVPAHKTVHAELKLAEDRFSATFEVITHVTGIVKVVFTNKKKNNEFLEYIEGDISKIMQKNLLHCNEHIKVENNEVLITTHGKCQFRFGSRQDISVKETDMIEEKN